MGMQDAQEVWTTLNTYYEPVVRGVGPIERKDCTCAQSNISQAELSPELKRQYDQAWASNNYRPLFDWIDSFPNTDAIVQVISPVKPFPGIF
jgi:hypothetical protein